MYKWKVFGNFIIEEYFEYVYIRMKKNHLYGNTYALVNEDQLFCTQDNAMNYIVIIYKLL